MKKAIGHYLLWAYLTTAVLYVYAASVALYQLNWDIITFDQWRIYATYFSLEFPSNVLALQNGHRPIIPGLFYLIDIHFFGAQNQFLTWVGALSAIGTCALIARPVLTDRELSPAIKTVASSFVWISVFWLANLRVLGHGNESVHAYFVTLAFVAAAWCLVRFQDDSQGGSAGLFWTAVLLCAIATFSFGPGIVTWPALLLLLLFQRAPIRFPIYLAAGWAVCAFLYLFVLPGYGGVQTIFEFEPWRMFLNSCIWLGAPVFHIIHGLGIESAELDRVGSGVAGAAALISCASIFLTRLIRPRSMSRLERFLLALAAFGAGAAIVLTMTRTSYFESFPIQIVANRYLVWPSLFWAAYLALLGLYASRLPRFRTVALGLWFGLLAAAPALMLPEQFRSAAAHESGALFARNTALGLVVGVRDDDRVRGRLYRNPALVYQVADELWKRRLSMFRWEVEGLMGLKVAERFQITPNDGRLRGTIDGIAPFMGSNGRGARIRGWGLDRAAASAPRFLVVVDESGTIQGLGRYTERSPTAPRTLGVHPREPVRLNGYVRDFREGAAYRYFAVLADGITAVETPVQ